MANSKSRGWLGIFLLVVVVIGGYFAFTYNRLVKSDEQVKKDWANLQATYQRRLDLVPNLVSVVKGASDYEKNTLQQLTEARSRAGQVMVQSSNPDYENFQKQEQAQADMANSANRVIAVIENYPDLKGTQNFLNLQSQLEGTERRIKVARADFNASVAEYNKLVRSFPSSMVAAVTGYRSREGFTSAPGADSAPTVKFN